MQEDVLKTIDPRILGRRIQEARNGRGLTQQEVADYLEVARTTVTALEKGDRRIRHNELIKLARILGRPIADFVGYREPLADFSVQFRTSARNVSSTEIQKEHDDAVHDFQLLCQDYLHLETITGARVRYSYPPQYSTEGVSSEDGAEDIALSERNRLGLGDGPIMNLRDILDYDVRLRVFYLELPSRCAGMFSYSEELGACVAVNSLHPEERRRWSMAHEYGHFLTNRYRSELTILYADGRIPPHERFADAFAKSLLMPATGLRRRFHEMARLLEGRMTAAEVCRIAHYYYVSVEAMMLRLEELRLLPAGTWSRLRDRGFKVREAQEELGLPPHPRHDEPLPLRYRLLAVSAYKGDDLTEGQLCRFLRQDRISARRTVQSLTHALHVLQGGDVTAIPIDLAAQINQQ